MSNNVHFSPNQLKFIDWLATPKFDRSPPTQELFANNIGVNPKTLVRWKKVDGLQDAVVDRAKELLHTDLPDIYGALRREAIKGSFQHIKLAFEMTGEHIDKLQNVNVDVSELTTEQLERIAAGEDALSVIATTGTS